jgi:anti-sigma factor RsiW
MMSCSKFETDIALYAGGDLPAGRIARIESHLAECADCRVLAEELRALVTGLSGEPLEDAMVAQVHQRVMAELGRAGFSLRGALAPLLALAAALLLATVLMWPRHSAKPTAVAHVETPHVTPVAPAARTNIVPVRHRAARQRRRAPAAQPGPPLLVQFVTDDPNIVVYWLINQKPQGD